jgi:heme-degrading monooxygenase HmoA
LRYEGDANKIVHLSVWDSLDSAKQFFESPKLMQIRGDAGVESPDFIYLEEIENGIL